MADPIWLDTCTLSDMTKSPALEAEIKALGGPFLMVAKTQEELYVGNPFKSAATRPPEEVAKAKAVVQRLNVQLDTQGTRADRVGEGDPNDPKAGPIGSVENQFKFKQHGREAVRAIEESDAIVLTQISASAKARGIANPRLMSTDNRLVNNADAKLWKIDIRLPANAPANKPGGGGGGSGGGLPPGVTTITVDRVTPGKGTANSYAAIAIFQIVDGLTNYLSNKFLQKEVNTQVNLTMTQVRSYQRQNPSEGALVSITLVRTRPNDDSGVVKNTVMIHPGDVFESISVYYGLTVEQAVELQRRPEARPDLGADSHYKYERTTNSYWVQPTEPALESPVGTWLVRVQRFAWLYAFTEDGRVRWTDPFNKETGTGKWQINKNSMVFTWDPPSTTRETWDYPLVRSGATGRSTMDTVGYASVMAVKQP